LRFRYKSVLSTSRISTSRGRPPPVCRGTGSNGSRIAHWASVRSEGYALRLSCSSAIRAPAFVLSAFYLSRIICSHNEFPESLSEKESSRRDKDFIRFNLIRHLRNLFVTKAQLKADS